MNKLFRLLLLALFIPPWLFLCAEGHIPWKSLKQPAGYAMVEPGDAFDNMVITTGANKAPPLWAFCSNSSEGNGSYILDCRVPVLTALGIGNIFLSADEGIAGMDWSDLIWQLSIDAQRWIWIHLGRLTMSCQEVAWTLLQCTRSSSKAQPGTSC